MTGAWPGWNGPLSAAAPVRRRLAPAANAFAGPGAFERRPAAQAQTRLVFRVFGRRRGRVTPGLRRFDGV